MATRFFNHRIVGNYPEMIKKNMERIKTYLDKSYLRDTTTLRTLHALAFVQKCDCHMDLDGDYKYRFGSDYKRMSLDEISEMKDEIDTVTSILSKSDIIDHYVDCNGSKFMFEQLKDAQYTAYEEDEEGNILNSWIEVYKASPDGKRVTPIYRNDRKYSM